MLTEKEAENLLDEKLAQIYKLLDECKKIANENDTCFHFKPAYGMGGEYLSPKEMVNCGYKNDSHPVYEGWLASSNFC